eukprot:117848-Pleurochrysis_carterae.AAC.1
MAAEASEDEKEGRRLVARGVRHRDGLGDGEVDGQGEAIAVEVFLAQLRDALELGDLVAQPLILRVQLSSCRPTAAIKCCTRSSTAI